jgi:N-acylneuraminate cytidylyltransferase
VKLALIPARGGSKRIPRKNVRSFAGAPVIAHSIGVARECGLFDRIVVSTDDAEIAAVARAYGAETPFERPAVLSGDHADTASVVAHAIEWMARDGMSVALACCIYPVAPFVRAHDIGAGLRLLESGDWDFAFPATGFDAPVARAFRQRADGGIEMFFPDNFGARSQDLPEALHDAAQFYWGRATAWVPGARVFGPRSTVLRIPRWRVQDIDTEEDWRRAELLASALAAEPDDAGRDPR